MGATLSSFSIPIKTSELYCLYLIRMGNIPSPQGIIVWIYRMEEDNLLSGKTVFKSIVLLKIRSST